MAVPFLSSRYYLNAVYHFSVNVHSCLSLTRQSRLLIGLDVRCSPRHREELLISLIVDRLIIYQDPWDAWLIMNLLEGKPTRLSSLALGFLVNIPQAICKTYLRFPHYVIVVVSNWSWRSTTKEPSLLRPASRASRFLVSMEALPQTNNVEASSRPMASGVDSRQATTATSTGGWSGGNLGHYCTEE